jgi:RNA polymerase sigma-70 factor (ECF subfamily)
VDTAEDITQSVFTTVAGSLRDGGYEERGRFEAWLFRVAMNRVRDECRRARHRATPTDPVGFEGQGTEAGDGGSGEERDRDLSRLRSALSGLGEADREVIELRHHAQMSFKAIAEQLGEPVGTVLARHHRALGKLRIVLAEQAGAGGAL